MSLDSPLEYGGVWKNLEALLPEHRRTACRRRRAAERRLAELMTGPPAEWLARLEQRRFHTQAIPPGGEDRRDVPAEGRWPW